MKLTIEIDEEIKYAIEIHLTRGVSVQSVVKASLNFFRDMHRLESNNDKIIGFGPKDSRFKMYNTEASPEVYLRAQEDKE